MEALGRIVWYLNTVLQRGFATPVLQRGFATPVRSRSLIIQQKSDFCVLTHLWAVADAGLPRYDRKRLQEHVRETYARSLR